MTVYNPNIPQPSDRPSDSQDDLLNNFLALKVFLDRNHVAILDPTTGTSEGKHKFMQMPEQAAAPASAVDEGALYTKQASAITNLFWRLENSGTEVQMTNIAPSLAATGYTFLPGGLLLQWGRTTLTGASTTISFPTAFSTVYRVVSTLQAVTDVGRTWNMGNTGNASFAFFVENFAAGLRAEWIAVGQKV